MAGLDDAMKAATTSTKPISVTYKTLTVSVNPPMQWRQSAMEAIPTGQFNAWARGALETPADVDAWVTADLMNSEVVEFFAAYAAAAGQSPGE